MVPFFIQFTFICAIFYPIDTLIGTIAGLLCAQFVPKLYHALGTYNET
jgi:hypothetical protein